MSHVTELARQQPLSNRTITEYYQTNLISTTSAEFANNLLEFHIKEIGAKRIMFSIDYPFQSLEDGMAWFDQIPVSEADKKLIANEIAIDVLRLDC